MALMDYENTFVALGIKAKAAAQELHLATDEIRNKALAYTAVLLDQHRDDILQANAIDLGKAQENGVKTVMIDRLRLTNERIDGMIEGIQQVISLPTPLNQLLETIERPNGLVIKKVSVPLGVTLIMFEARPNVTVDASVLSLKAGNAVILRGGKEALETNKVLVSLLQKGAEKAGLPQEVVQLITIIDREAVSVLLRLRKYIDVVIPRGSASLINRIVEESTIPVIETGAGVCHVYIDKNVNLDWVVPIVMNAKAQRPSVCNAIETLLIHKDIASVVLPSILLACEEHHIEVRGDAQVQTYGDGVLPATEEDWSTEYNDYILSIKVVNTMEEAIEHINMYGTKHSESILTEDIRKQEEFMQKVDAAVVYANASTRFTDGFEFGMGAEIGISTQKLHARGPMGLTALTSYKYLVYGDGQIRI